MARRAGPLKACFRLDSPPPSAVPPSVNARSAFGRYSGHIPNSRDAFGTTVFDHYPTMNSAFRAGDKPHTAGAEWKK